MKSKSTVLWFVLAVALAACLWIFDRYFSPVVAPAPALLPGMNAEAVTEIQIFPAAAREITAVRTNQIWQLQAPFAYPAQAAAIDALLGTLEKISPQRLTAGEVHGRNSDAEFGFANPQFSLTVAAGDQQWQLRIGNKTAPGDQVFVRVVGLDGVFVADAGWDGGVLYPGVWAGLGLGVDRRRLDWHCQQLCQIVRNVSNGKQGRQPQRHEKIVFIPHSRRCS